MSKKSLLKYLRAPDIRLLATLSTICFFALLGAWFATEKFREHVIDMDVYAQTIHWKDHFPAGMENLEGALKGEPLTAKDKQWLDFTIRMSGVFRYKFYSADGMIVNASRPEDRGTKIKHDYFHEIVAKGQIFTKVSHKPIAEVKKDRALLDPRGKMSMGAARHGGEHAATAGPKMHVDKTGAGHAQVYDLSAMSQGADLPVRTVSEVYIPYMKDGRFLGAAEVYLDSTAMIVGHARLTDYLRYGILILCLFIFLSGGFFIVQNMRERERSFRAVLDAEAKVQRKNRLETLGVITSKISQEMRNPLGTLKTTAYLVAEKTKGKKLDLKEPMKRIERATERLDIIISDLLDMAAAAEPHVKAVAPDACVEMALSAMKLPKGIKVTTDLQMAALDVAADPQQLRRALSNLVSNAVDALTDDTDEPPEGRPTPEIAIRTEKTADRIEITVADNGPGITPDDLDKVFEPLFTTKGGSVGLGLSAAREIMLQHGGGLEITSDPGKGTTATLWLPLDSLITTPKRKNRADKAGVRRDP